MPSERRRSLNSDPEKMPSETKNIRQSFGQMKIATNWIQKAQNRNRWKLLKETCSAVDKAGCMIMICIP